MYFYSGSTLGWYHESVHGERTILVPDPDWLPVEGQEAPLIQAQNPSTLIPPEAVDVADDVYAYLVDKRVGPDANGYPVELPPALPTEADQIFVLDAKLRQATTQVAAIQSRIDAINDAIEFEEVLPEEIAELPARKAQMTLWKKYRIDLGRVKAATGWYLTPAWPALPEPYTSETSAIVVSAQ